MLTLNTCPQWKFSCHIYLAISTCGLQTGNVEYLHTSSEYIFYIYIYFFFQFVKEELKKIADKDVAVWEKGMKKAFDLLEKVNDTEDLHLYMIGNIIHW